MTALAGVCGAATADEARRLTGLLLDAQSALGPHDRKLATVGDSALGRNLFRLLPEDAYDEGPLLEAGFAMVADARIDNREEVASALGLGSLARVSDSRLLFRAYLAWGEDCVHRVVGDYAAAVWNEGRRELVLFRDTVGEKPLNYHLGPGWVAFASVPLGLAALPGVGRRIDGARLADFAVYTPRSGPSTYYGGVERVEPGRIVVIRGAAAEVRDYWTMPSRELRLPSGEQYEEAFREHLDRAVRARLRGTGQVGSHLSGGLDSGAVTSTAARLLAEQGRGLVAFTAGPRAGFAGPTIRGRIVDETALAALVAARYPNIEQLFIRADGTSPVELGARDADRFAEPLGLLCNQVWVSAIHDSARDRGIHVVLTGEGGNVAASAGGVDTLAELIGRGRPLAWARAAASMLGRGPRLRGLLAGSFGPWIPEPVWRRLDRFAFGELPEDANLGLLRPEWRDRLRRQAAGGSRRLRPPRSEYRARWDHMRSVDPGTFRKGALAGWGVEERDCTSDRRLVEFSFSVPPEQLIGDGVTRRLARRALRDRLPPEVLDGPRGYQGADWYERIDRDALLRSIQALRDRPGADRSVVDTRALAERAAGWPADGWGRADVMQSYRFGFLRALAAAQFQAAVEDGE